MARKERPVRWGSFEAMNLESENATENVVKRKWACITSWNVKYSEQRELHATSPPRPADG